MTQDEMFSTIAEPGGTVAYFSTPECNVCKVLRPKVEELVSQKPRVRFLYVDSQKYPSLSGQHLVFAAPTIILFLDGREINRFSRNVSLGELDRYIDILSREAAS